MLLTEEQYKSYSKFPLFTATGYKTLSLPPPLRSRLTSVWKNNRHDAIKESKDGLGEYIVNTNTDPSYLLNLADINSNLKQELEEFILDELNKWTGIRNLVHTASYGIREYADGTILKSHTDRATTHVLSAIIHVGSIGIRKPWALTVENRHMRPRDIFFDGTFDIILYESSTLVHGRPAPFEGSCLANMFIHAAPSDWAEQLKNII